MPKGEGRVFSFVVRANGSKALRFSSTSPITPEEQRQALITVYGPEEGASLFNRIEEAKKAHRSDE